VYIRDPHMEPSELPHELRELMDAWPLLKAMLAEYAERQTIRLRTYRPYNRLYTVRLNAQLVQDLKAYADRHHLSQSEIVTEALGEYLRREEG
jgi:hypothetical protein